jgi:uncharacterized repeat protein (TIGR01451 family)
MKTRNLFALFLFCALIPGIAAAQGMKTLYGHVPAAVSRYHLKSTGRLAPDTVLNLTISLPLQNQPALNNLFQQVYDPSSSNYHHFLTPGQFNAQFGPSDEDYKMALNFAKVNGLNVVATYSNRMIFDVSGKASDVEKAFQVRLHTYHHPTEKRDFYAPDSEPLVSSALPVYHISGLNNYLIPHPLVRQLSATNDLSNVKPNLGSGPGGEYMGKDFRAAYAPGVTLDGTGQNIGLFELDGYYSADIASYEAQAGLANLTLTNVNVDGGVPNPSFGGSMEVFLDIEMDISMATNASQIVVYEAPNGLPNSSVDLLSKIASDDSCKQISSSWGIGDDPAFDVFYVEMALQGQSFFQASGDDDAYYPGIPEWADDTNITLVGGTTLSTAGPIGAWTSETVWNWFNSGEGQSGSGGGTNINEVPIPGWQQGINMTTNGGSTTLRNVPDVALTADNIFITFGNGFTTPVGGTSAAAPLWAAFTALVNEQATNSGVAPVGFLNPAIYSIGKSANYTNCFHDITTGNNTNLTVGNMYFAAPGYDLCTGWGTPNGSNLINALVSAPTTNVFTHISPPLPPYGTNMVSLNGSNPNGNWFLFIQDDQSQNAGMISNGWAVTLTTANPIGFVADDYLSMSASPTNLLANADTTIYLDVHNYGPSASSNVVVSDVFPSGFILISSSSANGTIVPNGNSLFWDIGNLTNSASAQMTMTLQAPNGAEQNVVNSASVSANTPDQNSADSSASAIFNVALSQSAPSLSSLGFANGRFYLTASGSSDFPVIIQSSTNLVNWVNISTNTPPFTFTDTVSSSFPDRFYRALVQ